MIRISIAVSRNKNCLSLAGWVKKTCEFNFFWLFLGIMQLKNVLETYAKRAKHIGYAQAMVTYFLFSRSPPHNKLIKMFDFFPSSYRLCLSTKLKKNDSHFFQVRMPRCLLGTPNPSHPHTHPYTYTHILFPILPFSSFS